MPRRDLFELVLLGALWGSSFLFMRVAAPEFGPVALIAIRVAIAALVLAAMAHARGELTALRGYGRELLFLGLVNSAVPFSLFAYATLSLPAGFAAVLNATAPLFGALLGYLVWHERMAPARVFGLALGFAGVVLLVSGKLALGGERTAVFAAILAASGYGLAAHFAKRRLAGLTPLGIAAGSQIGASLALFVPAVFTWPAALPSARAWGSALALGLACTALAYLLYFRLIAHVGAARAMTVTYLIPVFGFLWGAVFLGERLGPRTLAGGLVILAGTALVARVRKAPVPLPSPPALEPTPCPSSPTRPVR
jgi:drug/metabolite transporter (DMT)-like permease